MAVRRVKEQLTPAEQVKARQVADRVARARRANPPRDPTGEHHETMAELARECGRDVVDLLDLWDERSAHIEYDAGLSRTDAEQAAAVEVVAMFERQRRIA